MRIGAHRVNSAETMTVVSPFDGTEVGRVPRGGVGDIDAAIDEARRVLSGRPIPAWRRAEILDHAAQALEADAERFARLIAAEVAKPIRTARAEVARATDTFRFSASVARTITGEMVALDASHAGAGKLGFTIRVPIGVVGAISPFNFPLNLVAHKVAPAIAVGCPVVLKPASSAPLTALALADLLIDVCGLPPGWLNVVTVEGSRASALVDHDGVEMITFTGSPDVGWAIRAAAPRKKVSLELGNNSPIIIEPDADLSSVAQRIAVAAFSFSGQSCISVQRIYVHHEIADVFAADLVAAAQQLVVGDPLSESTDLSSLISPRETQRVMAWVDEAVQQGAEVMTGGSLSSDGVIYPTVVAELSSQMKISHSEVFGPVVGIARYADFSDALRMANDTRYGLQAGVYTSDLGKAMTAARELDFGGVTINEIPAWRADQMPYGGIRNSGNTKEGPAYAAREMTRERLVVINS